MRFTASEIVEITGGRILGIDGSERAAGTKQDALLDSALDRASIDSASVDGASIDSRTVEAGSLFVPLVAERDGHDFIPSALDRGVTVYLTSQDGLLPAVKAIAAVAIKVEDTMKALTALGAASRRRLPEPVIGVTGSVGKTSVKDLIAAACSDSASTHANKASFNNELGLPLTLVNAPDDTKITVLEMGSRGAGHVADLCQIGLPTIGVVTRVAEAHTELFGSLEKVAEAKGELVASLPAGGVAILNADDPLVLAMASRAQCRVVTFGVEEGDFRAANIKLDEQLRPTFMLECPLGDREVALNVAGAHMALNAVAAVAAAVAAGVDLEQAIAGVERASVSALRMEVTPLDSGLVVINDSYNANPTSMRAGLDSLRALSSGNPVAVLGVMAELGSDGEQDHREIASEATESGVRVIAVDAPAYGPSVEHVSGVGEAKELLACIGSEELSKSAVLVKGSRVAGLESVANWLISEAGQFEGANK